MCECCHICGVFCICCKCEWLGSVEIPYYACCGNLCSSVNGVNMYLALCSQPNEHKCRNCVLCALPCLLNTLLCPPLAVIELLCMTTCTCCGSIDGHACECFRYVDTIKTQGWPSVQEIKVVNNKLMTE